MKKYVQLEGNKILSIFEGSDIAYAKANGFVQKDILRHKDGKFYLLEEQETLSDTRTYVEKRTEEYPPLTDQLDMIYHNIEEWKEIIRKIKDKFPKD